MILWLHVSPSDVLFDRCIDYMKSDSVTREIDEFFERGVGEFIDPDDTFKSKLAAKMRGEYAGDIIVKFGVDPTRPDIHLGHAAVLRKLRKLQDWGCTIVFLIGDFTARIGDPTGKSKVRPEIEQREIEENMKTYLEQVGSVLATDERRFSWIRNSDWLYAVTDLQPREGIAVRVGVMPVSPDSFVGKAALYEKTRMQITHLKNKKVFGVTLLGLFRTLRHITHARIMERDMFQDRIREGRELYMHEMLYPVIQGIDSVALHEIYGSCDLEVGGTDQTFNMLMGRAVMKINKKNPQAVLSVDILVGTDGKEKMSKSLDNYIGITDSPGDMYGKVMSVPDSAVTSYFELATFSSRQDIERVKKELEEGGKKARDAKMNLARQIVETYHGEEKARRAEEDYVRAFQKKGVPSGTEELKVRKGALLADILVENGVVASKKDFRRLVKGGAIKTEDGSKISDENYSADRSLILKIGKKRFVKIIV